MWNHNSKYVCYKIEFQGHIINTQLCTILYVSNCWSLKEGESVCFEIFKNDSQAPNAAFKVKIDGKYKVPIVLYCIGQRKNKH